MSKGSILIGVAALVLLSGIIFASVSGGAEPIVADEYAGQVNPVIFNIDNYYPGGDPDKTAIVFYVPCSNTPNYQYAKWQVETDVNETEVEIQLRQPLANYDTDKVSVTSHDINETVKVITYKPDKNTLVIGGLLPESKRIIELEYPSWTRYHITCSPPYLKDLRTGYELPPEGFESWVIIDEPVFTLKPGETQTVTATLKTDTGTVIEPDKWEYWLDVEEYPYMEGAAGVYSSTMTHIRCLVSMKS